MKKLNVIFIIILLITQIACRDDYRKLREARAIWISRFDYVSPDKNPERMKSLILNYLRNARNSKMNIVFFQVRGNADAFYNSSYEPWSKMLTGTLGKDPDWDPLQFAIDAAHNLGLELHVWINTFPVWRAKEGLPEESNPRHIMLEHPDWIVCDKNGGKMNPEEGYICLSPGIPEVKSHICKVVMDIVRKYDVDGVHFDYIRYPEESKKFGYSSDEISRKRFNSAEGNPQNLSWGDWQRNEINTFVSMVSDSIRSYKPYVKISAAVIGSYKKNRWNAYDEVFQDPIQWLNNNKMHFIVPMTYMKKEPFMLAINEWKELIDVANIYPGLAAYKANEWGWEELWDEIEYIRENGFQGLVFFSASSLNKIWKELINDKIVNWANIPYFQDGVNTFTPSIKNFKVERIDEDKVKIEWDLPENGNEYYFNIYRTKLSRFSNIDDLELVFITPRGVSNFVDNTKEDFYYAISVLNRYNKESEISKLKKPINVKSISYLEKK